MNKMSSTWKLLTQGKKIMTYHVGFPAASLDSRNFEYKLHDLRINLLTLLKLVITLVQ